MAFLNGEISEKNETENLLMGLGLDPSSMGFLALSACIDCARQDPLRRTAIFKEIYPEVVDRLGLSGVSTLDTLIRRQIRRLGKLHPGFVELALGCAPQDLSPARAIASFAVYLGSL